MALNITRKRFGALVAIEPIEKRGNGGNIIWRCRCDCGKEFEADGARLRAGHFTNCGCQGPRRRQTKPRGRLAPSLSGVSAIQHFLCHHPAQEVEP